MSSRPHAALARPALVLAAALTLAGAAQGADLFGPIVTEGADTIIGGLGNETLEGRGGADSIRGMEGDDVVYGNEGDDSVGGGPGDDRVHGGRGRDVVNGGQGNDTLSGDRDNDTLIGGLGADRFVFDNNSGDDTIADFSAAEHDSIELPTGMPFTVADTPAGFVIQLGAGGGRLLVAGVKFSAMGAWQAGPQTVPALPSSLKPVADPPPPPRKLLLGLIVALSLAFTGLLGVGLFQLVRSGRDRRS